LVAWSKIHSAALPDSGESAVAESESRPPNYSCLASFADAEVPVDGWLLLMSDFKHGLALNGRRLVLFSDAMPLLFPLGFTKREWSADGHLGPWILDTQHTLTKADGVITYSRHVAEGQVERFFGTPADRITVIRHAVPDLRADLPHLAANRLRTEYSHKAAANLLRNHSAERGWTYLANFPFEDVVYVAVSTQDRPTKNYPLVVEALRRMIRRDYHNVKLLVTAAVGPDAPIGQLSRSIHESRMELDAISVPDLPRPEHAAFYHCAAVTVHPSLIEGGHIAFPWSESVSVGTPCIVAHGPHIEELLREFPEFEAWVFDPYDVEGLIRLISETIANRDSVLARQSAIFDQMRRRTWADVAGEYAEAVTGKALPSRRVEACA
jgi:glycosyltransferase involved in cell wall biosynthesis